MREFNFWCAAVAQIFLLIFSLFKINKKLHEKSSLWKEKRKSVSLNGNNCVWWQRPVNLDWLPSNRGFPVLPDHVVDHGSWIWPPTRDPPIPPSSSSGWRGGTVEGPPARRRCWRRGCGNHSNSETQSHPAARETKAFIRPHMEGSMQILSPNLLLHSFSFLRVTS